MPEDKTTDPHVYSSCITRTLTAGIQAKRYFTKAAYGPFREVVRVTGPGPVRGLWTVYFTDGTVATATERTRWETRTPMTPEQRQRWLA